MAELSKAAGGMPAGLDSSKPLMLFVVPKAQFESTYRKDQNYTTKVLTILHTLRDFMQLANKRPAVLELLLLWGITTAPQ